MSLRAAFLLVALAVVVPFAFLFGYLAVSQVSREKARVGELALSEARRLGVDVDRHVGMRLEAVAGAAAAIAGSGNSPGVMESQARRLRLTFPDLDRVLVLDELGAALFSIPSAGEGRRLGVGDQEWFKRTATAGDPFVGGPSPKGAEVLVGLYAPVRTPEGSFLGVVAADLSLRRVQELLGRSTLGRRAVVELLSDRAIVLARQPALFLMRDVGDVEGYPQLLRAGGGWTELVFEDGERRLAGAVPITSARWFLAVGLPSAEVLAGTRRRLLEAGGAAAVVAMCGIVGALVVGRRRATGMERLGAAMKRLAAGDIPASVPVTVGGDVGALTDGFNRTLGWLRGKLREYEALSQVDEAGGAVTGARAADTILPSLLRKVVAGMGADAGVMLLHEENALVPRAGVGLGGASVEGVILRRGQGLAWAVSAERGPVVITDVDADYRVEEAYLKESGIRSVAGVPLESGDQVIGVLEVAYRLPHVFPEAEVQRLSAMARRSAQAIERARAVDVVQRNTQGLEAQLAEKLQALQQAATGEAEARQQAQEARRQTQELERKMRQQAAAPPPEPRVKEVIVEREVVRADPQAARLRATMQKTVTAELRVLMGALMELPRFLVEGLQKPLGEEERQQLEILHERGQEVLELIEGLTILTGLEAGQVKAARAPLDLAALVQRVVRNLQPRAAARGNRIETDVKLPSGHLTSDARRLEQVLTNLLLTAIKYTEVGEIRLTCYARGGDTVLTVADDGAGFSPEEQRRLFEPFLQVGPRGGRTLPGTGLLLIVCQRLVDLLGGRIRVESEVDRGTWFTVTLPGEA